MWKTIVFVVGGGAAGFVFGGKLFPGLNSSDAPTFKIGNANFNRAAIYGAGGGAVLGYIASRFV